MKIELAYNKIKGEGRWSHYNYTAPFKTQLIITIKKVEKCNR